MFRQLEGGGTKVSLRSRGPVDVEGIAREFGGGGHRNAAGFASDLDEEQLHRQTIEALQTTVEAGHGAAKAKADSEQA